MLATTYRTCSHYINDRLQCIVGRQFKEVFSSFLVSTDNTDLEEFNGNALDSYQKE